ncbi:hypothetical protein CT19431_240047 [Cupriavidus taiwanensis]|nr:hypothetical protein CT19431_240047 [Cupriavidus taiwanensis]
MHASTDIDIRQAAPFTYATLLNLIAPKTMFRPDPAQHGYPTNMDYFNAQKRWLLPGMRLWIVIAPLG